MIETGGAIPFLLFVFALLLGALHGLGPGHSKTMMAAYIVTIKGTVSQAVVLVVSAALSHSTIVWALAMIALTWGNELIGEQLEPWFMMLSGVLVLGITLVGAFSIGLALTLMGIGLVTAIGLKAITARSSSFEGLFQSARWISAALITVFGQVIIWTGYNHWNTKAMPTDPTQNMRARTQTPIRELHHV